jgi:hypothetical protein
MPTLLAFPEPVAEGFQIVFLTTLDDTIAGIMLTLGEFITIANNIEYWIVDIRLCYRPKVASLF